MTSFAIYRQNKYKNDPVALNKIEFFYYLLNFPTSRIDEKRDLDLENYI